jgi:hypothetical protein
MTLRAAEAPRASECDLFWRGCRQRLEILILGSGLQPDEPRSQRGAGIKRHGCARSHPTAQLQDPKHLVVREVPDRVVHVSRNRS